MGYQIANNTTLLTISTANTNLDGSGTIAEIFNASGTYGSILTSIRIQSITSLSNPGMIRFFMKTGAAASYKLIKEVPVPISTLTDPPYPAFGVTVDFNLSLKNDYRIGVSTDNGDTFEISGFGIDINGFI